MNKRFNNKILLAVLGALVLIFFITNYVRDRERIEQKLPSDLIGIDSADVELISISTPQAEEIKLSRKTGKWQVESKGIVSEADQDVTKQFVSELLNVKPERLVAKSEEKWQKYSVNDSLATKVSIAEKGSDSPLSLYFGRFNYRQPARSEQFYGGNPNISAITYVRPANEEAIYAVEGFLATYFQRSFNSWRKADFLKVEKAQIDRIDFSYPEDSGYSLTKTAGSKWLVDQDLKADSSAVETYLNFLSNRSERNFADDFTPDSTARYILTISGSAMEDLVIQGWEDSTGQYYLHSSLNPDAYFRSPGGGLFWQLFVSQKKFFPSDGEDNAEN